MPQVNRRTLLKLMGASLALAGAAGSAGCRRWPERLLAPHTERPEGVDPGSVERYASQFELGGVGRPVLVTAVDGRPIKIDGNPAHPLFAGTGRGPSDSWTQATLLELYDPERAGTPTTRSPVGERQPSTFDAFDAAWSERLEALRGTGGAGLAVLAEESTSPTLARLRGELLAALPRARWFEYEALSADAEVEGARLAFGQPLRPVLHLQAADVVVCLDADLLGTHPAAAASANAWATRRDPEAGEMARLIAVESTFTVTGTNADHRVLATQAELPGLAMALASRLGVAVQAQAPTLSPALTEALDLLVHELQGARGRGLLVAGPALAPEVHALCLAANQALGNLGRTLTLRSTPDRPTHGAALADLAGRARGGEISTLVILGGNPVYDAPADLGFAEALAGVELSVHLAAYDDETSAECTWHLPRAHWLEAWGDAVAADGTLGIVQPVILPLHGGRSAIELAAVLAGLGTTAGYHLVRDTFATRAAVAAVPDEATDEEADEAEPTGEEAPDEAASAAVVVPAFDEAGWRRALHDGYVADSAATVDGLALTGALPAPASPPAGALELTLRPDAKVYDGRFANNGWLQELPDPLTKLTWDNALSMAPGTARELGIAHGDFVQLTVGEASVEVPAFVLPGQAPGSLALALGYGRTAAGHVGDAVGVDAYRLRSSTQPWLVPDVSITPTGRTYRLATTQDHHPMDKVGQEGIQERAPDLIRSATLEEYQEHPDFAHHHHHGPPDTLQPFDPPVEPEGPQWGMVIDLSRCTGCGACTVACQAENNVAIVGRSQVLMSRELHWLRVDRYFQGDPESPQVKAVHQPVACHHCENAPCEQVCPVGATTHDSGGLNVQVYNRCIGTRYCSNNCPYKVRRFNFFDYHVRDPRIGNDTPPWPGFPDSRLGEMDELTRMRHNPSVTVRQRGIMEKCTFCIQRIEAAEKNANKLQADGTRPDGRVHDGEVVTACQAACPTGAILFGDISDPESAVAKALENPRRYALLTELNTRPRLSYLARVTHPKAEGDEP